MRTQSESLDTVLNPLDHVEEVLAAHDWIFDRMTNDELMVEVAGKSGSYRLFFIWQAEMNAMQFCCQYELYIPKDKHQSAGIALMTINENLWMGHFDLPRDSGVPSFRHTCLFRGLEGVSFAEHIEDMMDISLAQCERYYPVFHLLAAANDANDASLSLALMETAGES